MGGYKLGTKSDLLKTRVTNSITTLESLEHAIFPTVLFSKGYFIARESEFSFPNKRSLFFIPFQPSGNAASAFQSFWTYLGEEPFTPSASHKPQALPTYRDAASRKALPAEHGEALGRKHGVHCIALHPPKPSLVAHKAHPKAHNPAHLRHQHPSHRLDFPGGCQERCLLQGDGQRGTTSSSRGWRAAMGTSEVGNLAPFHNFQRVTDMYKHKQVLLVLKIKNHKHNQPENSR